MLDPEQILTNDIAAAICARIGFALIDGPILAEVFKILDGYRDAIRAPLLADIAALTAERDALRADYNARHVPLHARR
jgi:hypothetical protein